MQGNGFKIFLTVFFFAITGYYLYPSVQSYFIAQDKSELVGEELATYEQENLTKIRNAQEKALKLGLDLQGGMHVTLEVRVEAMISELATDVDDLFTEVLAVASRQASETDNPIIDLFVTEFESRDASARLSRYFRNEEAGITRRSSNADVAAYLRLESDEAVDRAISIIRDRVDRYGVTEPSIQKQGTRRVIVELPGIDDPDRIRGLLRGTARLEFHLMIDPAENVRSLQRIIAYYDTGVDSTATGDDSVAEADTTLDINDLLDSEELTSGNELLDVMQPLGQGVMFGQVLESDTTAANTLLSNPVIAEMLPRGVSLMYTSSPVGTTADGEEVYALLGVRDDIELTGDVITDARVDFDQRTNVPEVTMVMNSEGSRTWARLTGANVGNNIAIVLDGVVYSYPNVLGRISGGRSNITNLESQAEAQDIVTVLKSGALPAPVEIVQESTVGASLGQASIDAGLKSVMFGLALVALFMIFYYRTGGSIADIALILNLIFILGILAGFGATLTLPGIAGIVLTIGMAVDANVLIFERVREEQSTGKTLKASMEGGYAKALSAIFDANITTFFVGVILYSFGLGPIQGFAVTLMAGILSSMFTAIIFTRILMDYMVVEKKLTVSFG
ncbi:MAG: protein translocase subunit SecD [Bacteroidetes Order II. Incertae sedis bacterium]|jgi:preprotein translocase subunit SecD|nr:protein translocase subunit SecD [Bacteroidetes Order II. bacterium]MBT4053135.1 protein translocase subunit SecD [Bacteroidetes Order II. bacterium]MBT5250366.1 protein translocase subunit SecD [Bacteroidetes Order II. bacterium]MBT6201143.1 protein translocase subunit SecD [Bacteroidetes Order II. bacterium]MBT6424725.1 protein translocase subunit SecD [Bacteroidetes Order II. bacterium]